MTVPNLLPKPTEQQIVNSICDYLTYSKIPFVRVRNVGAIIERDGKKFFGRQRYDQKGVADIIACFSSKAIAIEVKKHNGVVSPDQTRWLCDWEKNGGGIAIIARSLDDVIKEFESIKQL